MALSQDSRKAFPKSISLFGDARAALARLDELLAAPERSPPLPSAAKPAPAIEAQSASITWSSSASSPSLAGLDFAAAGRALVMVAGPVGAGKSLLLSALAAECVVCICAAVYVTAR